MKTLRKDDQITGYDKKERRQGIVNILSEVLGETHSLVDQVRACQDRIRGDEPYCQQRLFCDLCSAMRFRLLKSTFYLNFHHSLKPLYTVVAKPKTPLEDCHEHGIETAFKAQIQAIKAQFNSFLGAHELTWTDLQPDKGYFWPHTHVVAYGLNNGTATSTNGHHDATVEVRKLPATTKDIDAALWHHCKPLPISWFPEKYQGTNIVKLDHFTLTPSQRNAVREIIDSLFPLMESLHFDRLVFSGIFAMDIYQPNHKLRYLLQSYALDKRLQGLNTLASRAHFVRVTSYFLLTLLEGMTESQARLEIGLPTSEERTFRRWKRDPNTVKRAIDTLRDLRKENIGAKWTFPKGDTDQDQHIITTAIQQIEFAKIQAKTGMSKSSLERILRKYHLSHRDMRRMMNAIWKPIKPA